MSSQLLTVHKFSGIIGPLLTIVMNGVGLSDYREGNAAYQAQTPALDNIFQKYGYLYLAAHGTSVGYVRTRLAYSCFR